MSILIEKKVKSIVCEVMGIDSVEVSSRFVEDLGCDSLDTVEIVMFVEEAFDISLDDDRIEDITTVQLLIDEVAEAKK